MSKNQASNTYNFVSTSDRQPPLDSDQYHLIIRQQPKQARLCNSKERDRRPVDPPPIIQLKVDGYGDEAQNFLQSPYYFMCANLEHPTDNSESFTVSSSYLAGTVVSSLHKLKDIDNNDGGFFVFGDISVRVEGRYRLRFSLFEIVRDEVVHIQSVVSDVFTVYSPKTFPGMPESTFLSRSFSDQGVRIRIRKEHRIQMKRPPSNSNRQSEGDDDNMNDDGMDRRKRSKCNSMQVISTSSMYNTMDVMNAYYPPSQQSPYVPHHQQRGLSYPPPLGYSQLHPPQRKHSYYDDSEHESSSHDDHVSIRRSSLSSSSPYHNEPYEQSVLNKRPRLSNMEITSNDYRQPSTTAPLNNNHFATNRHHHHNVTSPPSSSSSSPYRSSQRGTTLPPLLEHPLSSPVRHHSFDALTSTASSSLDSFHYPATYTETAQSSQPSNSYYRPPPPPPSSSSSSSSSSSQLFHPKPPVRSRTLPYIGGGNNGSHIYNHHRSPNSNQLPTPQPSQDNKKLYPYPHHPLTPPISVDSHNNGNDHNDNDNDTPRFTQHFTLSPRPVPLQLPSKSPLSTNSNNNGLTKANSLPVMSSVSNMTTPLNHEGALTSSPQLLPTTIRLPPITTLTGDIDCFMHNNNSNSNYNGVNYGY